MTKDELTEYFETYIKEYSPFKDNNIYQTLLRYLVNYYYDNLYNIEPRLFKTMFEENEIPREVYDNVLVSIGLPKTLINTLSYDSKIIFLKTFSDFERYKASLSFVQNLALSYNDFLNIYELYIDYDTVNSQWILRPKLIYKSERVDLLTDPLIYDEIYPTVPTLLVDSDQLTNLKNNNKLVLPIKSNLLLLDYELSEQVSILHNLINSTFLKSYGANFIPIYFKDLALSITLKDIFFVWYYLLTKYYDTTWVKFPLNFILNFNIEMNPFSVADLDSILDEYDEIDSRQSLQEFYDAYLYPFGKYHRTLDDYDQQKFHDVLTVINSDLTDYLDERINNSTDERKEIKNITNEIYNSIMIDINASTDVLYQKYSQYYLSSLSQLTVRPENTDTYLILYNLKPFHTEIVTKSRKTIYCEDKFNQVYFDEENQFLLELIKASMLNVCDSEIINIYINKTDSIPIFSSAFFHINITSDDQIISISDYLLSYQEYIEVSLLTLSDINHDNSLNKTSNLTLSILDGVNLKFNNSYESKETVLDDKKFNNLIEESSLPTISDKLEYTSFISPSTNLIINSNNKFNNFISNNSLLSLRSYLENNILCSETSLLVLSDTFEIVEV